MPFYHLGAGSPLSNTAVAAGVTSSGSWGLGVMQSTRLRGDELRLDGVLAFADLRYQFYGAGADAGMNGTSVPIVQKAFAFAPELLLQAARGVFGVRYRGVRGDRARRAFGAARDRGAHRPLDLRSRARASVRRPPSTRATTT